MLSITDAKSLDSGYHGQKALDEMHARGIVMKTIPVEQLDETLNKALEAQGENEAIGLTKDADTVAWVFRVPKGLKDTEADAVFITERASGRVFVVVQTKHGVLQAAEGAGHTPVFGAGRGTLTIVSEDDEHLKEFQVTARPHPAHFGP